MSGFKFRDSSLKLTIVGHKFSVDVINVDMVNRIQEASQEALKIGEKGNTPENVNRILKIMSEVVDEVLGEGAAEKIFADRIINFPDMADLLLYLTKEIIEFRNEQLRSVYSAVGRNESVN